jgi:hypothetical protein
VNIKAENANDLDFESLFQSDLPPETKQLEEDDKKFERDSAKEKDYSVSCSIVNQQQIRYKAEDILKKVRNFVP